MAKEIAGQIKLQIKGGLALTEGFRRAAFTSSTEKVNNVSRVAKFMHYLALEISLNKHITKNKRNEEIKITYGYRGVLYRITI